MCSLGSVAEPLRKKSTLAGVNREGTPQAPPQMSFLRERELILPLRRPAPQPLLCSQAAFHCCVSPPVARALEDRSPARDVRTARETGCLSSQDAAGAACFSTRSKKCAPFPAALQCRVDARSERSKPPSRLPLAKIRLICRPRVGDISDIKLIRTDTTLDLSQKAEKR